MNTPTNQDTAREIVTEFNVLTAGEGDWADGGEYANRFPQDVRRSDVNAWLIEKLTSALDKRDAQHEEKIKELRAAIVLNAEKMGFHVDSSLDAFDSIRSQQEARRSKKE